MSDVVIRLRLIPVCEYGFGAELAPRASAPSHGRNQAGTLGTMQLWGADTGKQRRASVQVPLLEAV